MLELTNADSESYVQALNLLKPLDIPLHSAVEEYVVARHTSMANRFYLRRRNTLLGGNTPWISPFEKSWMIYWQRNNATA